ncbi:major facilitator superfamily domain-containing protein [Mycena haematopus]|nr:major facilitator superfamily domain-containing protein [Mycena haematopus]
MSSRESWTQEEETFETDPLVAVFPSRSRSLAHQVRVPNHISGDDTAGEREPLLGSALSTPRKKPFYRARPLWLVPFAIGAALIRGMTLSSRVEVYTQLSCSHIYHKTNMTSPAPDAPFHYGTPQRSLITFLDPIGNAWNDSDSGQPPSRRCKSDPAVQAGAARIQTMISITMGLLSALTTGWWGQFGERFGRTKVLAICTFGWFLSDSMFLLASAPFSPFASHGLTVVLLAPVFEGLLGGWSTIQSGTSAYISDCTSSGSRASVFSRFTGVSFLGFSLGPIIGGWLIRHPIALFNGQGGGQSVDSVFCVAAIASFLNFCLMLFVIPESVSKEQRDRASGRMVVTGEAVLHNPKKLGIIKDFFSPLAIFLPVFVPIPGSTRKRRDWSLTLLTCALFGYMLSAGLYQIKYLYGSHVYSWGPEQLSYYISFMGGGRALFLLIVFPFVIARFKPKSNLPKPQSAVPGVKAAKPKPTKAHLAREIKFDLRLTRISLCIDIVANTAIVLAPAPPLQEHALAVTSTDSQFLTSQALFVVSSSIASWGAGLIPAVHSLALCILQARALLADSVEDAAPTAFIDSNTGKLFGALAVLQALGQMILGPLLFGLIYSGTVAMFPKAVFVTAIGILFVALMATMFVRSPLIDVKGKLPARRQRTAEEEERGRSRASKDLRGGFGSTSGSGSSPEQFEGPSSSGSN